MTEGMLGGVDILQQQVSLADMEHFLFQQSGISAFNAHRKLMGHYIQVHKGMCDTDVLSLAFPLLQLQAVLPNDNMSKLNS